MRDILLRFKMIVLMQSSIQNNWKGRVEFKIPTSAIR